jgi:hypothetical protein
MKLGRFQSILDRTPENSPPVSFFFKKIKKRIFQNKSRPWKMFSNGLPVEGAHFKIQV